MIRRLLINEILETLEFFPVAAIVGARQVGKTTMAKLLMSEVSSGAVYLDLESSSDMKKLEDPELFFSQYENQLIVIDEIQVRPELYSVIRSQVDKSRKPSQFLLLGSASPDLIKSTTQTLAGRIAYHQLYPFSISEIPDSIRMNDLWLKGGFPKNLLTKNPKFTNKWMENFIYTYLQRDMMQFGISASPQTIGHLWMMLAHFNGSILNMNNLSKSLSISVPTIKRYIEFLEGAFLIKTLYPYSGNLKKRLVKSPKVYISDTGVLHHLLSVENFESLLGNPVKGSSWEAFVLSQIFALKDDNLKLNYYRTYHGAETDIVFVKGGVSVAAAEVKFTNSPKLTKGNKISLEDLNVLERFIITPSSDDFLTTGNVRICSIIDFLFKYLPNL